MHCAIYARYSDESQNPRSTDDQISQCRQLIEQRGWALQEQHVYSDDAVSGIYLHRNAYSALKAAARAGAFACIIVDDLSRLGRNAAESIDVYQEFTGIGVSIIAIADGIDSAVASSKLPYYFKSITNELFLDDLKAKIVRGLRGQILRGYSAGGRVYGYDAEPDWIVPEQYDKFRRRRRHGVRITVNTAEATTVRKIFTLYASGQGYRAIAAELNSEHVPSPHALCGHRSGFWQGTTIRTLLRQVKYTGDWTWNRAKWKKKTATGKRLSRRNPSSEWVHRHCEELRIIPPSLWNQVQERLGTTSTRKSTGSPTRFKYILSGILKCPDCGSSLVVVNSKVNSDYVCCRRRSGGIAACPSTLRLPRALAEKHILDQLRSTVLNPTSIRRIVARVSQLMTEQQSPRPESVADLIKQEGQLQQIISRLVACIEDGTASESIVTQIREREGQLYEIREKIDARSHTAHPPKPVKIDTHAITAQLSVFETLLDESRSTATGLIGTANALLRRLFTSPMTAHQETTATGKRFQLTGLISPLALLNLPEVTKYNSGAGI